VKLSPGISDCLAHTLSGLATMSNRLSCCTLFNDHLLLSGRIELFNLDRTAPPPVPHNEVSTALARLPAHGKSPRKQAVVPAQDSE
jgi:hypothetical protein